MLKKSIALFLSLLLLSANVFADNATVSEDVVETGADTVYELSLEEAIDIALDGNPQLNASSVTKDNYKIQLKGARETKANYRDTNEIYVSAGYDVVYIKSGYYVHMYESLVKLSDYAYKQIEAQVSYNVTEKYFTLKNCEKLLEIAQNSYNLVKENYDATSLSYDLGLISKTDFDSAKISLMQAEYTLESYKDNYNIAKEDFKIALRKNNEDCDFILTSTLNAEEFETNLAEDLVTAEASRYDILSLKSNYELAKEYFEATNLPENTTRYGSAYSNYITAEYNYTNNRSLILLGVKSSYNNINSTKNNVALTEETLNLKKNAYKIAQIKFEQGMITNTELMSAMNDVYTAEVEFENAKLKYILAVDKYKYDIQIGL